MNPPGFATSVDPGPLAEVFEGALRPGHFRGVATVCVKLFAAVRPDRAYFGAKDAQQVAVLKRVVTDLDLALELVVSRTDPSLLVIETTFGLLVSRNAGASFGFLSTSTRLIRHTPATGKPG